MAVLNCRSFAGPSAAMSGDDSTTRSWSELPVSVLAFAFEKLDLKDRAGTVDCIARVCTSWAAAAATSSIELSWCYGDKTDSLQQWLRSRGSHVFKVTLHRSPGVLTSLPCPRLRCLVLEHIKVDLRHGSQLLQDLSAATALEHLHLHDVHFKGEAGLGSLLLSLPALTSLHLTFITEVDSPNQQQQQSHASTATAVQDSQVVTHSFFWSNSGGSQFMCITDEGMQLVCKPTQLQSLELHSMEEVTAAGLASLYNLPALKRLTLNYLCSEISANAVPAFTQLTALTCLKLAWAKWYASNEFDPSVLTHMTQLQELLLYQARPAGGASGAAELLARLAQLPKLQVLHLAYVKCLPLCPPAALASLTSSSMLRSLTWSTIASQPGPWQHMFPDSLRLSALTELETEGGPCWNAPDLDRLVSSCSNLQKLSLHCTAGLQLTALLQLTDLVQLWLRSEPDNNTMTSLAQLTVLRRLAITEPCEFSGSLFMPLTALTQLTHLALPYFSENGSDTEQFLPHVDVERSSPVDDWPDVMCEIIRSTAPVGAPPDVWSQLLSCCEAYAAAVQQPTAAPQQQQEEEEEPLAGLE